MWSVGWGADGLGGGDGRHKIYRAAYFQLYLKGIFFSDNKSVIKMNSTEMYHGEIGIPCELTLPGKTSLLTAGEHFVLCKYKQTWDRAKYSVPQLCIHSPLVVNLGDFCFMSGHTYLLLPHGAAGRFVGPAMHGQCRRGLPLKAVTFRVVRTVHLLLENMFGYPSGPVMM